jgi:hypothetical protein
MIKLSNSLVLLTILLPLIVQAESTTLKLYRDWNLISVPVQLEDDNIARVLTCINGRYSAIYGYDNGTAMYTGYLPGLKDELRILRAGSGYWIHMDMESVLTVSGTRPDNCLEVSEGWNLVGFNSLESLSVKDAIRSVNGGFLAVYGFDNSRKHYLAYMASGEGDLVELQPGNGYWIYVTRATSWCLRTNHFLQ